ncbi:hypothetical protein OIU78_016775 [Salix suchowensis]|nr:hypothetical protein OIU78_016775 [Salix suchowensis]
MASISMHATAMNQVIPNEIWVSLQSEDSSTMKVVRASHAPDGRKVDVKPILRIIDNILLRASPAIVEGIYEDKGFPEEDMIGRSDVDAKLKTLASIIKKVSSELFSYNNLALSGTFKANNVNQITIPYGATVILRSYRTIYKEYEDEKSKPAYWDLVKTISSTHSNNMTILKTLLVVDDETRGDVALKSMKEFGEWRQSAIDNGLFPVLSSRIRESQKKQRCSRIILSGDRQEIPNKKLSSDGCECSMEKCFVYRCCAD